MIFTRGLGCKRGSFDHRDALYAFQAAPHLLGGPTNSDLSINIDWVYDQGHESSCVAHAITSNIRYLEKVKKDNIILPSRNFIYYNARANDNPPNTNADDGTEIRSGLQGVANGGYGFCPESMWGYQPSTVFAHPPIACYNAAESNIIGPYRFVNQDRVTIQAALAGGQPVVFGIEVFKSMMSDEVAESGIVPMPTANDEPLGGHAIMMVGANNSSQQYKFLNSWGENWGQKGFGFLPFSFVESSMTASDFYVIDSVMLGIAPKGQDTNPAYGWKGF